MLPPFNLHRWIAENRDKLKPPIGNRQLFAEADLKFHRAVTASTGNFILGSFSAIVETALVCATLLLPLEDEQLRSEAVRRHAELFEAIVDHDGDRASRLMTDMVSRIVSADSSISPSAPVSFANRSSA